MLLLARNYELIKNQDKTYLTVATQTAGTTNITVNAVDSNAWADNDYLILGEIGSGTTEIMQVNGAVSDGTSLVIDNNGSGGVRFVHPVNEPLYRIAYNKVEFSRAATATGSKTVLATNEIQPDDEYTRYEDTTNTTGYGFIRFYNSTSGAFSAYSDAIPYTGYTPKSLGRLIKAVRRQLDNYNLRHISDEDIIEELNEKQRRVAHMRLWPFLEGIRSASTVAYQRAYGLDDDVVVGKPHTVTVKSEPLAKIDTHRFDILHWDTARTGDPTHVRIWGNSLEFYPLPSSSAQTNTLNGALTATATSITVNSTSGFSPSGRLTIDSEIISYNSKSSTQFLGCERGLEESTAATHTDTTTVTERDIVYSCHVEPNELVDIADETPLPRPSVLIYGAAMELAKNKMKDTALHDRNKVDFEGELKALENDFGRKGTFSLYKIKDAQEVISDGGVFKDPNRYPTNLS